MSAKTIKKTENIKKHDLPAKPINKLKKESYDNYVAFNPQFVSLKESVDELKKINQMLEKGEITQEQYDIQRKRIIDNI